MHINLCICLYRHSSGTKTKMMTIILTVENALVFIKIKNKLYYFNFYNHRENCIIFFVNFYPEWTTFPSSFIICFIVLCIQIARINTLVEKRDSRKFKSKIMC